MSGPDTRTTTTIPDDTSFAQHTPIPPPLTQLADVSVKDEDDEDADKLTDYFFDLIPALSETGPISQASAADCVPVNVINCWDDDTKHSAAPITVASQLEDGAK